MMVFTIRNTFSFYNWYQSRHVKRTKDFMLTYRRSDSLEIFEYFDSDFVGCQDRKRSTSGYIFMLVGGVIS